MHACRKICVIYSCMRSAEALTREQVFDALTSIRRQTAMNPYGAPERVAALDACHLAWRRFRSQVVV